MNRLFLKPLLVIVVILMLPIGGAAQEGTSVYTSLVKKYGQHRVDHITGIGYVVTSFKDRELYNGFYDYSGKEIIPPVSYHDIYYLAKAKMFRVRKWRWYGLVDLYGKEIVPPKYTKIEYMSPSQFLVQINDDSGVLDSNGTEIFPPQNYESVYYDYDSHVFICINHGKRGIIGNGRVLLPCTFDEKELMISEGIIAYKKNQLWGFMDAKTGNILTKPRFTSVEPFEHGVAKVSRGDTSLLITNPLYGDSIISSINLSIKGASDIDVNIPNTKNKKENTFVIIISNENNGDIIIPNAHHDGRVAKEYFMKTIGIPVSNIFHTEDATANNIKLLMGRISDIANVFEGEASIIFYYVGLCGTDNSGQYYLYPTDASMNTLSSTGYSFNKLLYELDNSPATTVTILIDAWSNKTEGQPILPIIGKPSNHSIIIASINSIKDIPVENKNGHGVFTYHLCKKIKESKGKVSLYELSEYMSDCVSKELINANGDRYNITINKNDVIKYRKALL